MQSKLGTIGSQGIVCLIINQIFVKLFIGQARLLTSWVGNAAWMLYLGGILLQIALFLVTAYFYRARPQSDPIDLAEDTFGAAGRGVIGLIFFVYFLCSYAVLFRFYTEALKTVLFSESPIWIVVFILLICVGMGSHAGLSPLTGLHNIFVPLAACLIVLLCILNINNMELYNILPLFGKGFAALGMHLPLSMGAMSEISMLYFLLPFAGRDIFPKKVGVNVLWIGGGLALLGILAYCLAVDFPESTEYLLSMYQLARQTHIGASLNRFEDITELFWILVVILALSFKAWMAAHILKKTCRLPDSKPLTWPIAFLGMGISFVPLSMDHVLQIHMVFIRYARWEVTFLPLFVVLCHQMKQRIKGARVCKKG